MSISQEKWSSAGSASSSFAQQFTLFWRIEKPVTQNARPNMVILGLRAGARSLPSWRRAAGKAFMQAILSCSIRRHYSNLR
jgi:hypothetical protein